MSRPYVRMKDAPPEEQRDRYYYHRRAYLPGQIDATRHKLRALEAEARRYGLDHLIEGVGG